jgi:hypothetical protein
MAMAELYLRDDPSVWRTPPTAARPGDPAFIVAVNIVAGWVYEIAGPFFWAAIVMLLVLGGAAPR